METLFSLSQTDWAGPFADGGAAIGALEAGRVIFLPKLAFAIAPEEASLLDPGASGAARKNISFDPASGDLGNVALAPEEAARLRAMMRRFANDVAGLVRGIFPTYTRSLEIGRTSFRPLEIKGRDYSPRHDDRRLHIDAFPSRPLRGKRILRLFSNIAPDGAERRWQVGEPFADFARTFAPRLGLPLPGSAALLALAGITKGKRSAYDHVMLKLHDGAKLDDDYRRAAPRHDIAFPAGSTWLCFTDQVLHAALAGHAALEQTFYLPVAAMADPATAPLRVLEKILARPLV